jgi:hypothetical protein
MKQLSRDGCRPSLAPVLPAGPPPPDVVLVQTSAPVSGTVSLVRKYRRGFSMGSVLARAISADFRGR